MTFRAHKLVHSEPFLDLSRSAHLPSRLAQRWARRYFLEPVWLGSKDFGVRCQSSRYQ